MKTIRLLGVLACLFIAISVRAQSSFTIPVQTTTGAAVTGANVTLTCTDVSGGCHGLGPFTAFSTNGNTNFSAIPAGNYTVSVSGPGITTYSYAYTIGVPALAFNLLSNGTNTTGAMVVGTGASLSATGTGSITATAETPGISVFPASLNNIKFASQFAGADCGAKIVAADAVLGTKGGQIWVDHTCGTAFTTPIILHNDLVFIDDATYNQSATITIGTGGIGIYGRGFNNVSTQPGTDFLWNGTGGTTCNIANNGLTEASSTVTIVLSAACATGVGQAIDINSAGVVGYNGAYIVQTISADQKTITVTDINTGLGTSGTGATVNFNSDQISILGTAANRLDRVHLENFILDGNATARYGLRTEKTDTGDYVFVKVRGDATANEYFVDATDMHLFNNTITIIHNYGLVLDWGTSQFDMYGGSMDNLGVNQTGQELLLQGAQAASYFSAVTFGSTGTATFGGFVQLTGFDTNSTFAGAPSGNPGAPQNVTFDKCRNYYGTGVSAASQGSDVLITGTATNPSAAIALDTWNSFGKAIGAIAFKFDQTADDAVLEGFSSGHTSFSALSTANAARISVQYLKSSDTGGRFGGAAITDEFDQLSGQTQYTGLFNIVGALRNSDGTSALPSYTFTADTGNGFSRPGNNYVRYSSGGVDVLSLGTTGLVGSSGSSFGFSSGNSYSGSLDTGLSRLSAGVIAVGTGAQGSTAGTIRASGFLPTSAGGADLCSAALPCANLWLGTAATNNFKFAPNATSAARTVTLADPGANVTLPFLSATDTTTTHAAFATATGGVLGTRGIVAGDLPSIPLNQVISPTGAVTTLADGNNPVTVNCAQTTDAQDCWTYGETSAATNGTLTNLLANQAELNVSTASGSTAAPLEVQQGGCTATTCAPLAQFESTWNNASLVGQGIVENVTNTASAASSLLENLRVGNATQWSVDKGGLATGSIVQATTGTQIISGADYTNSTTTPSTVFTWTLPATSAAKTYRYTCDIMWESTAATLTGPVFGVNISAAPTQLTANAQVSTAVAGTYTTGYLSNATTGSQTLITSAAAGVTTTNYPAKIWGTIEGAPTAGSTFIINAAALSNTTSTLNIRRGSGCTLN